ncbi:MAG: copper chaperone PCu(A)C [Gallionella sp.]|nr:copper chaperone PCu(A)C [Gallionella sp.]MDD4945677.1 copper chaperone PCu(A)C [Gallionella sp.]MDD5611633.1 copper chaperone PCu(A)C [Gallionella sp.]
MKKIIKLCGLLGLLLVNGAFAADGVRVEGAWSRATAPGQNVAMVDMSIVSDKSASLVGASSPACSSIEIHSMTHDNGMMKMRQVQSVELPAGERVALGKSGYHLMLLGLKQPLAQGETVPLTLNFKLADKAVVKVEVKAEVRPLTEVAPNADEGMHHHHMHH